MTRSEQREKDPAAYRDKRRLERIKYREKTGTRPDGNKSYRQYTERELEMIISSEFSDPELAVIMNRSVIAIQNKRSRMRKEGYPIKNKGEE